MLLTPLGMQQAKVVKKRLSDVVFDAILSSPLPRARHPGLRRHLWDDGAARRDRAPREGAMQASEAEGLRPRAVPRAAGEDAGSRDGIR